MIYVDNNTLDRLRKNKSDLLIVSSWFYKIGYPIISDDEFNRLEIDTGGLDLIGDDVDAPIEIFNKYCINVNEYLTDSKIVNNPYFEIYMDSLYEYGTNSISPIYSYDHIYEKMMWLKNNTDKINISLKVDGVSTRNIIELNGRWNLVASLSRSRDSKGFDYTDGMKLAVSNNLQFNSQLGDIHEVSEKRVLFVFGECYVERSRLDFLRNKYGKYDTWKTPRSTALSMLRDVINEEDYKYLKFRCFKLNVGESLSEMFKIASDAGLDIVPYEVIDSYDIPTDRNSWDNWFNMLLTKYNRIQKEQDIEADGIVIAIDNQSEFNSLGKSSNGKYDNAMFSCKVGPWGSKIYSSEVVDIKFENEGNTSEYSVVAIVKPVKVYNGNTVTRVNCFNLKILVENGINIGSKISFEYKSASSIVLIYK